MKISTAFLRVLFGILSILFTTSYMVSLPIGYAWLNAISGIAIGIVISSVLFGVERLFRKYSLRAFNTAALGILFGALFGKALISVGNPLFSMTRMDVILQPQTLDIFRICLFLSGTYLGCLLTLHFSEEISISIPFLQMNSKGPKRKDLIADSTSLSDSRLIDLATTGLLDNQLVIPRFLTKFAQATLESGDETERNRAKASLETMRKLEELPHLGLRYDESKIVAEPEELFQQVMRLARLSDSNILTAETSEIDIPPPEGVRVVNLHSLSLALKPLMQAGRSLKIKIQRFGKEPNQGVGYLEDGTMVVVNGGGDFIGEMIDVQVLSVKHTTSGRMIFCNTMDDVPAKESKLEV